MSDSPTLRYQATAWLRRLSAALLVLLWGSSSQPAGADSLIVDAAEYPWSAIGRVNAGGRSFCTGFLVSERVVLTAAHCLYNFQTGRWWPPLSVHFVAGYQRDSYLKHSRAKSYDVSGNYTPQMHPGLENVVQDWAVITLAEPVGREVGWLGMQSLDNKLWKSLKSGRATAIQAGYRRDRAHAISLKVNCPIPGLFGDGNGILHSCDVIEGGSGSPLLVLVNGRLSVLGIHTMRARGENGDHYAGALSASIFHPKGGQPPAAAAARSAGLRLNAGAAPISGGVARAVPLDTIDLLLARLGYLTEDSADDRQRAAIKAFQRKAGLPETGEATLSLLGPLIRALR